MELFHMLAVMEPNYDPNWVKVIVNVMSVTASRCTLWYLNVCGTT